MYCCCYRVEQIVMTTPNYLWIWGSILDLTLIIKPFMTAEAPWMKRCHFTCKPKTCHYSTHQKRKTESCTRLRTGLTQPRLISWKCILFSSLLGPGHRFLFCLNENCVMKPEIIFTTSFMIMNICDYIFVSNRCRTDGITLQRLPELHWRNSLLSLIPINTAVSFLQKEERCSFMSLCRGCQPRASADDHFSSKDAGRSCTAAAVHQ